MRVAVIGAGITGLSAALELRDSGAKVTVFEADTRVGGVISTTERDGFLVESGPTSLMATAALETLIARVGLGAERLATQPQAKRRFIVRGGALVALPDGPAGLATSDALSASAKFALLREPFVTARRDDEEESLAALVRRRLNDEILDYLVNPLIAGIYAGDPERLSVKYAMPMLHAAERKHGSLLVGAMKEMAQRRGAVRQRGITSFRRGLSALPQAMAAALDGRVLTDHRVTRVERSGAHWHVHYAGEKPGSLEMDAVICATPAHRIASLGLPSEVHAALGVVTRLRHPPVATLALGFPREDVEHPLDGFGVLMPAIERRTVLGALFSSSVFAGRAPSGAVLITCFLGGTRSPETGEWDAALATERSVADLRPLLGLRAAPIFVEHRRWPQAIPQYDLGHGAAVQAAASVESALPGLYLCGQWRGGVALGDCIAQGQATATRVMAER